MSAPLRIGQDVVLADGFGREIHGTVSVTWGDGRRGVVQTTAGEVVSIRSDMVDIGRLVSVVSLDLGHAESVALEVLDGDPNAKHKPVNEQLLILAAAVLYFRRGIAQ